MASPSNYPLWPSSPPPFPGTERLSGTGPSGPIMVAKDRGYLILSVLTGSGTFSTSMEYRETIASVVPHRGLRDKLRQCR